MENTDNICKLVLLIQFVWVNSGGKQGASLFFKKKSLQKVSYLSTYGFVNFLVILSTWFYL